MPVTSTMVAGMLAILVGIGLATYGLLPRPAPSWSGERALSRLRFRAMDDASLTPAHWDLLTVLAIGLAIDVMKPATIGFVLPGMREEYGLSTAQAATLPLAALTGTTVGSLVWGSLADRIGRRASILLASLLFMATAICGSMPAFGANLAMCFFMGVSAGGMLPIVYALMAESVPAKNRGWLVVLHGGLGAVGGYLAASGLAALLEPHFGWRVLWLAGLPTGALMIVLNRWVPESPRFLLERGRVGEADQVMARYGVVLEGEGDGDGLEQLGDAVVPSQGGFGRLFRAPYASQTLTVGLYGLAWGMVNWGFITFLPTILEDSGVSGASSGRLLFLSALIAVPGTLVVAYLYGCWSSKKTMLVYASATVLTLVGFAALGRGGAADQAVLTVLVVLLLTSSGGVISMLSPYTAEVYPTPLRGTGSGLAAGSSKVGGMLAPSLTAGILAFSPGFTAVGLVVAAPTVVAVAVLTRMGLETTGRSLVDIEHTAR